MASGHRRGDRGDGLRVRAFDPAGLSVEGEDRGRATAV